MKMTNSDETICVTQLVLNKNKCLSKSNKMARSRNTATNFVSHMNKFYYFKLFVKHLVYFITARVLNANDANNVKSISQMLSLC